jgi:lipoate-protein ligase A
MHHGTLLFLTDINALSSSLKPSKIKIQSKGIKSIRARVTNIYEQLPQKMTAQDFFEGLKDHLSKGLERYAFSKNDLENINLLVEQKYSTFDWNVGRSPSGKNAFETKFDFGTLKFYFDTVDGKIKNPKLTGDFFSLKPISEFENSLQGVVFDKPSLVKAFSVIGEYVQNADGNQIVQSFFD